MIYYNYRWNKISFKCPPQLRLKASIRISKFSMTFRYVARVISRIATWMLFFRSLTVCGLLTYTRFFKKPHKKKSTSVRSHDLEGQLKSAFREITRWKNIDLKNVTFCWKYRPDTSVWLNCGDKKSLNIDWYRLAFTVAAFSTPSSKNDSICPKYTPNCNFLWV